MADDFRDDPDSPVYTRELWHRFDPSGRVKERIDVLELIAARARELIRDADAVDGLLVCPDEVPRPGNISTAARGLRDALAALDEMDGSSDG